MRHTSGFTYGGRGITALHSIYPASSTSLAGPEFINILAGLPLHHQPGTTWDYSLGLDVLGVAIERISGQLLGDYLQEQLFEPLGMVDTYFSIPAGKASRHAQVLGNHPIFN